MLRKENSLTKVSVNVIKICEEILEGISKLVKGKAHKINLETNFKVKSKQFSISGLFVTWECQGVGSSPYRASIDQRRRFMVNTTQLGYLDNLPHSSDLRVERNTVVQMIALTVASI